MEKEKLELKAALFDLDGVVFDTEPQYSVFWGSQCRLYHPEEPGLEMKIKGQTLDQIFDKHWNGPLIKERQAVTERLNSFEAQMTFEYIPGFELFVHDLRSHGVKTAVVTSSNLIKMESVYRQRPEFTALFDRILTSEDFTHSKPHPDCYLKAAGAFGLTPEQCTVFEDSVNGLKAGMAAGMTVVGLLTTNSRETVEQLSHYQTENYLNMDYKKLYRIWQDI